MKPYWTQDGNKIYQGDVLKVLKGMSEESVHCVCTSPPYWGLRDYDLPPIIWDDPGDCQHVWGEWKEKHDVRSEKLTAGKSRTTDRYYGDDKTRRFNDNHQKHTAGQFCQLCGAWRGCLGLEPTPELYIQHMVQIFRELRRVLRSEGTLWLNLGDSYAASRSYQVSDNLHPDVGPSRNMGRATPPPGLKEKDLCGIPWAVAFALRDNGWWLRSGVPWIKRAAMPESCDDRPASALEYVFLLTKSANCYFDMDAIKKQASPDSHRRYARGRSNNHKWANGGPGNQTIAKSMKHMTPGVTPKSAPAGSGIKANESFHAAVGDLVGFRNFRNTDLFFESLTPPFGAIFADDELVGLDINPKGFAQAHFATFPPRLPEVAILAGTSERGCCPECGAPWERVVEKIPMEIKRTAGKEPLGEYGRTSVYGTMVEPSRSKTIGWKPTCKCYGTDLLPEYPKQGKDEPDEDYQERIEPIRIDREVLLALWKPLPTIPAIVLDPFGGAMTTAIVAYKYDRKFTMIELSESYIKDIGIPRIDRETKQFKLFNRM